MGNKNGYDLVCKHCGKTFHHVNKNKVYCSDECKKAAKKHLICPICGKEFIQKAYAQKYCSEECHIKAKNMLARERFVEQTKLDFTGIEGIDYVECKICGQRMMQFHQSHLDMHNISREEYEEKYGKIIVYPSKHIEEHFSGENNVNHSSKVDKQTRKERSPFSKEFYKKRGLTEEDRKRFIKSIEREYNTTLEYYIKRGLSKEEAKEALAERQRIYKGGSYSKTCEEFIDSVLGYRKRNKKFLYGHNEKSLSYEENGITKYFRYDLTNEDTKTIIEFNGDFWHGNPDIYDLNEENGVTHKTYQEIHNKDTFKNNLALEYGYKIMIVWESDYFNNKTEVIKRCRDFIL